MRVLDLKMPRGTVITVKAPDHLIIPQLLERHDGLKGYEGHTFACALACLSTRKGIFYDIGANIGAFSLLVASTLNVKTHAFEPTPEIADVLANLAETYKLPITVHRCALSNKEGTAKFFLSTRSDASNTLNEDFRKGSPHIEVELKTLDGVLQDPPALIKIDVETAEPEVLAGGGQTIAEHRPFVIVEILNDSIGGRINEFFEGRGYSCYHITSKGVWRRWDKVPNDFIPKERNWLFSPEKLGEDFWLVLDAWRWRIFNS